MQKPIFLSLVFCFFRAWLAPLLPQTTFEQSSKWGRFRRLWWNKRKREGSQSQHVWDYCRHLHVITGIFASTTGVATAYELRLASECASAACVLQDDPVSVSSFSLFQFSFKDPVNKSLIILTIVKMSFAFLSQQTLKLADPFYALLGSAPADP